MSSVNHNRSDVDLLSLAEVALLSSVLGQASRVAKAADRLNQHIAESVGQTAARWRVLETISTGDCTTPLVAQRLSMSPQAVRRILKELVRDGFVTVLLAPHRGAARPVRLTPAGLEVVNTLDQQRERAHARLVACQEDLDLAFLLKSLQRLRWT